jgi:tetratricopeptide (TPR) repeat protein
MRATFVGLVMVVGLLVFWTPRPGPAQGNDRQRDAAFERGFECVLQGDHVAAARCYQQVEEASPWFELARAYRVWCLVKAADQAHQAAVSRAETLHESRSRADVTFGASCHEALLAVDATLDLLRSRPPAEKREARAQQERARGVALLARAETLAHLGQEPEALATLKQLRTVAVASVGLHEDAIVLEVRVLLAMHDRDGAESALEYLERFHPRTRHRTADLLWSLGQEWAERAAGHVRACRWEPYLHALARSVQVRLKAWQTGPGAHESANLLALVEDLFTLRRFQEAAWLARTLLKSGATPAATSPEDTADQREARRWLGRSAFWLCDYERAESLFRAVCDNKPKNRTELTDLATVLTGTVREVDGRMVYIPGLAEDPERAHEGWRLWGRLSKGGNCLHEYFKAKFHQELVRWAHQGPDKVRMSLHQLREGTGRHLDRTRGSPFPGYWEKRFLWLEEQIQNTPRAPTSRPLPPPALGDADQAD